MYGDDLRAGASSQAGGGSEPQEDKFFETHDVSLSQDRKVQGLGRNLTIEPELQLKGGIWQRIDKDAPYLPLMMLRDEQKKSHFIIASVKGWDGNGDTIALQMSANDHVKNVFTVRKDYVQFLSNLIVKHTTGTYAPNGVEYFSRPSEFIDTTLIDKKFFFDNLPTFVDTNLANTDIAQFDTKRFYKLATGQKLFFSGSENSGIFISSKDSEGNNGEITCSRGDVMLNARRSIDIQTHEPDGEVRISSASVLIGSVQRLGDNTAHNGNSNYVANVLGNDAGKPKWVNGMVRRTTKPANSDSAGKIGEYYTDDTHLYICTGVNKWRRTALETF